MKCKNCKQEVSSQSRFCEHCGEVIGENKNVPEGVVAIRNHLEFIGYEISENEHLDADALRFTCTHSHKHNLTVTYSPAIEIFLFVSNFTMPSPKDSQKPKLLKVINQLNQQSIITTFNISDEMDLITCAFTYPNSYSKKVFSKIFDFFAAEVSNKLGSEELQEFIS